MFGRSKSVQVEEPRVFGWKVSHLEAFAEKLTGDHPLVQTTITGIRHSFRVDGRSYRSAVAGARGEQDAHRSMPMIFDEPPVGENFCRLVASEYELAGTMWPPAIVQGSMAVCREASEISDSGVIGRLSITSRDRGTDRAVQPLLNFHFDFCNICELTEASNSLQVALSGNGTAWANFLLNPISNKEEWIASFIQDGYCSGIDIVKVYLNSSAGRLFDD